MNFEVIVHITGQLHQQTRDMLPERVSPVSRSRLRRRNRGRVEVLRPLADGRGHGLPNCADVWFCARYGAD